MLVIEDCSKVWSSQDSCRCNDCFIGHKILTIRIVLWRAHSLLGTPNGSYKAMVIAIVVEIVEAVVRQWEWE